MNKGSVSVMASDPIQELRARRRELYQGGGDARIKKQHEQGKLTARERLALLFDPRTFQESRLHVTHRGQLFGMDEQVLPGEGVVVGFGMVEGRHVVAASQDFTVAGGSVGEGTASKIHKVMDDALKMGVPFVFINDGAGARIQEGVDSLAGYGGIFQRNVLLSGVVPQISIIAGPCAGGAAYSPALTDFIIQVRKSGQMYITGPRVIAEVTGEHVTAEQLGGVESHAVYSGVAHFVAEDDYDAFRITKRLLGFLPSNNLSEPPAAERADEVVIATDEKLAQLVPSDPQTAYDMHSVIARLVDRGDFLEILQGFAPNMVIGFGRIAGSVVGVVANQPSCRAGVLDIDSSDKASRFVRFCNAFHIPLVTLVDVPGFLPGLQQEYGGIIRHGAKMLFAYGAATVPKITIVLRKAYGGAYLAMCGKEMGADVVAAWPGAEVAVMGAHGAVGVLYRKEIAAAADPAAKKAELIDAYRNTFASPYAAAAHGHVDTVIEPGETRAFIAAQLEFLKSKRELRPEKKHGLIPL